jgi:predicted PurR-regulated permease PerM
MQSVSCSRADRERPTTAREPPRKVRDVNGNAVRLGDLPSARMLTVGLLVIVTVLLFPYVTGLIGAGVAYVVARPVVRWIRPTRWRRVVAAAVVFALFAVIVLPGAWLLAELVAQVPDAARLFQRNPGVERLMTLQLGDVKLGHYLGLASSEIIAWSSRQTMTAIAGVVNAALNLAIAMFGAYYLLISATPLWEQTRASLPFAPSTSESLRIRFHLTTEAMLLGVVLTGVAQGTLVGVTFALLRVPQPLLWGAVTAFASVLPMFGSAIVWLPATLVLAAQGRPEAAVGLALLGLVVISNVDNALRLVVYRRVSQIHPMVTLVGAFAGVRAFGLAGVLIGPLILSYLIELFKLWRAPDLPVLEVAA